MPRDTRTYSVRDDGNHVTLTGYWSRMYDVVAIVGDEEDASLDVIASFDNAANAHAFVAATNDSRYIIGVRPPAHVVSEGIAWAALVASSHIESLPSGK